MTDSTVTDRASECVRVRYERKIFTTDSLRRDRRQRSGQNYPVEGGDYWLRGGGGGSSRNPCPSGRRPSCPGRPRLRRRVEPSTANHVRRKRCVESAAKGDRRRSANRQSQLRN